VVWLVDYWVALYFTRALTMVDFTRQFTRAARLDIRIITKYHKQKGVSHLGLLPVFIS
jgi:hypothetical protein